jgi:hypothetical protein
MKYIVKIIRMGDVEDPDIMVAQPIYEWQKTEAGKYVMENSKPEPMWHRRFDVSTYGYEYAIQAELTPEQITFYKLKFE